MPWKKDWLSHPPPDAIAFRVVIIVGFFVFCEVESFQPLPLLRAGNFSVNR